MVRPPNLRAAHKRKSSIYPFTRKMLSSSPHARSAFIQRESGESLAQQDELCFLLDGCAAANPMVLRRKSAARLADALRDARCRFLLGCSAERNADVFHLCAAQNDDEALRFFLAASTALLSKKSVLPQGCMRTLVQYAFPSLQAKANRGAGGAAAAAAAAAAATAAAAAAAAARAPTARQLTGPRAQFARRKRRRLLAGDANSGGLCADGEGAADDFDGSAFARVIASLDELKHLSVPAPECVLRRHRNLADGNNGVADCCGRGALCASVADVALVALTRAVQAKSHTAAARGVRRLLKSVLLTSGGLGALVERIVHIFGCVCRVRGDRERNAHLSRFDQALRLLEYMTAASSANQAHVVRIASSSAGGGVVAVLLDALRWLGQEVTRLTPAKAPDLVTGCLLGVLRVLVNLTNENQESCALLGDCSGMGLLVRLIGTFVDPAQLAIAASRAAAADARQRAPPTGAEPAAAGVIAQSAASRVEVTVLAGSARLESPAWAFDGLITTLGLLTNVTEWNAPNRDILNMLRVRVRIFPPDDSAPRDGGGAGWLVADVSAVHLLTSLLLCGIPSVLASKCRKDGRRRQGDEEDRDQGGCSAEEDSGGDDCELSWTAEELVMCAYLCLLLGCLIRGHPSNRACILGLLPSGQPILLIRVLQAFVAFQREAGVLTQNAYRSIMQVSSDLRVLCTEI